MGKIDFAEVARRSLAFIDQILNDILPDGKIEGAEYVALNPTRPDNALGSFKINRTTGAWSDFATGDAGGDIVSLYAYVCGVSQSEAARALSDSYCGMNETGSGKKNKNNARHNWLPIHPVPDHAPEPPKAHYHYGPYSIKWPYYDGKQNLLGYTCRFDKKDGDKDVLPLLYCVNEKGDEEWRWRSFEKPRPLYGLDRLHKHDGPVLIVEGEKCADAAYTMLKDMVVVSWPGGSKAIGKVDFSSLAGRNIVLWPDNDKSGIEAMQSIAHILMDLGSIVTIIDQPTDKPKGWDVADAISEGWGRSQILYFIENAPPAHAVEQIPLPVTPDDKSQRAGRGSNGGYSMTDTGNALRLADNYGNNLRYVGREGAWYWWDGARWREDATNMVYAFVDKLIGDMYREAANASGEYREALGAWTHKLESMSRQKALVAKAQTVQEIAISPDEFDRHDYLITCRNVTLDLSSGELEVQDHSPGKFMTKMIDIEYNPEAECPQWQAFLVDIFATHPELISFIQRAVGYSLVGDTSEQCLFFAYGIGKNGKSVFFETLKMLFGEYYAKAPVEMLMQTNLPQHTTDITDLQGKRFVITSEIEENRRINESRVKDLTGGDDITARRMRENNITFRQTHKLWMFGNHRPLIVGTDIGIKRRIKMIPFEVIISEDKRKPMRQLLEGFRAELSGILNWALQGFMNYHDYGLQDPDIVLATAEEYFSEMDILGQFIEECCIVNEGVYILGQKFWGHYKGWCEGRGEHVITARRLFTKLRERGFAVEPGHGNKTVIRGIDMREIDMDGGHSSG